MEIVSMKTSNFFKKNVALKFYDLFNPIDTELHLTNTPGD